MGLLALVAMGWALVTADGDDALEQHSEASLAVVEDAPSGPSTATLVETPQPSALASNPFESSAVSDAAEPADAATDPVSATLAAAANATAAPAASVNPFSAMQAPPRDPANVRAAPAPAGVAPRPGATVKTPAASAPRPAQPAQEAGLLQTLMDNIQQPPVPERDTRAMDRLARQLDRAPMPEASAAGATVASAVQPASKPSTAPQEKQTLRAMLDRCPSAGSPQGQRCRRQMCARAGVEPRLCTRH